MIQRILSDINAKILHELPQGCSNRNLPVSINQENRILRIYCSNNWAAGIEQQISNQISSSIPSPTVYKVGKSNGYTYVLHSVEKGTPLRDLILDPTYDLSPVLYQLGQVLNQMTQWQYEACGKFNHQLHIPQPKSYYEQCTELLNHLASTKHLSKQSCKDWEKLLTSYKSLFPQNESHLVHGDFDISNIMVQKNTDWELSSILDWEFSRSGSTYQDMANMLRYTEFPIHYRRAFLDGICEKRILPESWETSVCYTT